NGQSLHDWPCAQSLVRRPGANGRLQPEVHQLPHSGERSVRVAARLCGDASPGSLWLYVCGYRAVGLLYGVIMRHPGRERTGRSAVLHLTSLLCALVATEIDPLISEQDLPVDPR